MPMSTRLKLSANSVLANAMPLFDLCDDEDEVQLIRPSTHSSSRRKKKRSEATADDTAAAHTIMAPFDANDILNCTNEAVVSKPGGSSLNTPGSSSKSVDLSCLDSELSDVEDFVTEIASQAIAHYSVPGDIPKDELHQRPSTAPTFVLQDCRIGINISDTHSRRDIDIM